MKIAIVRESLGPNPRPDELDTLAQAGAVAKALQGHGHSVVIVEAPDSADWLRVLAQSLEEQAPDLVWNLADSPRGDSRLAWRVPELLERMELCFTGAGSQALRLTNNKLACKQVLREAGLPTPNWVDKERASFSPGRWIIKSVNEPGSYGMDAGALVYAKTLAELQEAIRQRSHRFGPCYAEQFIAGREFSLTILEGSAGFRVLPPSELMFLVVPFGDGVMDYRAKWDPAADKEVARCFIFAESDAPLLARLESLALQCWEACGLAGYARVDFRVDFVKALRPRPWIIDVNTNPCMALDAGVTAAAQQAGMTYDGLVAAVSQAACALVRRTGG